MTDKILWLKLSSKLHFLCVCQNLDVVGIKETYLAAGAFIQNKYAKKGLTCRLSAANGARSCVSYFKTKPKGLRVVGRVLRDHQRPDFAIEV